MAGPTVLVTGGAGYIGSYIVHQLMDAGESVVVLDDLSTGFGKALGEVTLVQGDVGNPDAVSALLADHAIDSVIHLAASTNVPESISEPVRYYQNNTTATLSLIHSCLAAGVKHFIFSSTAAVYGMVEQAMVSEASPTRPISPYGFSKLFSEQMLTDVSKAQPLNSVSLRYFNVAGANPEAGLGNRKLDSTLLVEMVVQAALGLRDGVTIFGTDYDTPDGTGIRDYIHVEDVSAAHIAALNYLRSGGESTVLNVGYGKGYSVREVVACAESIVGYAIPVVEAPRRPGDPAQVVADSSKAKQLLGWAPQHDDLTQIIESALLWRKQLMG